MTGGAGITGGVSGDGETVALLTPPSASAHTVAAHNTVVRSRTHRCPTNTAILREVAVSMVACRGRWLLWLKHWQREMDSATARGMTKLECCGYFGKGGARGHGFRDCARNDEVGGAAGYFGNDGGRVGRRGNRCPTNTAIRLCTYRPRTQHRRPFPHTPLPYQHRHTARSRSIHGGVQRALASLVEALAEGEMDSATARGMTKLGCCGYFGKGGGRGRWIPRLRAE